MVLQHHFLITLVFLILLVIEIINLLGPSPTTIPLIKHLFFHKIIQLIKVFVVIISQWQLLQLLQLITVVFKKLLMMIKIIQWLFHKKKKLFWKSWKIKVFHQDKQIIWNTMSLKRTCLRLVILLKIIIILLMIWLIYWIKINERLQLNNNNSNNKTNFLI